MEPSFQIVNMNFSTQWYEISSYSAGFLHIVYNLSSIGINNIVYSSHCSLLLNIVNVTDTHATVSVVKDENLIELNLNSQNLVFYYYDNTTSKWTPITSQDVLAQGNQYLVEIPDEVDKTCFLLKVSDDRGITATSFYSTLRKPQYTYIFNWNATGMENIYSQLEYDKIVIEVLQNGTLRWLGQKLLDGKPIPPVPVKCIRVSANSNAENLEERQIPFQVEDWASDYTVPLSRSNKETKFSYGNMIVFLIDHTIKNVTIWWGGRDSAEQTSYATQENFDDKIVKISDEESKAVLNNGVITMEIYYGNGKFYVETSTSTANFMKINGQFASFHASPSFPIINGTVRDIVQQEPEWNEYQDDWEFPNTYSQIVLTLPANTTYYTYSIRTIFVNASTCPENRILSNLVLIKIESEWLWNTGLSVITENGTIAGLPVTAEIGVGTYKFYNYSDGTWEHHWSEYIRNGKGAGVMFTDSSNMKLYTFDDIAGGKTGAVRVSVITWMSSEDPKVIIEICPVANSNFPASFDYPLDLIWHGAVVTFDGTDLIYDPQSADKVGLWVLVEHPPAVQINV